MPAGQHRPRSLELEPGDVHIWSAFVSDWRLDANRSGMLSLDERQRAGRMQSPAHKREFVASRTLLRTLLSAYTGRQAESIRIVYGRFGKPRLADHEGDASLTFNTSRSHGLALYAFGDGRQIGVDVEHLQPEFPCAEIAERYFSPSERTRLSRLRGSRLTRTFFDYWSAKEAVLKAGGYGLAGGLDDIDVHELDEKRVALIPDRSSRVWTVTRLELTPGYAAAIAVEGTIRALRCRDLALCGTSWETSESYDATAAFS